MGEYSGGNRDGGGVSTDEWMTPKWLAEALGPFDLDPCGSASSHIDAPSRYGLDLGLDGLTLPWSGSVFVNGPYSDPMPWCKRLRDHTGPWCALWKLDPSTKWWSALMEASPIVTPFRKRIKFEGDVSWTANFPSVLVFSAWAPPSGLKRHLWLKEFAQ